MNFINVDALLSDLTNMYKSDFKYNLRDIIHYIGKYPTVRTDTYIPTGEWISNNTDSSWINRGRHCSICNYTVEFSENFCPNCGARMKGGKEYDKET